MRKILLTTVLFFFTLAAFAQKVHSSEKGSYINHTVAAKESFFSIARTYNLHPKEIAAFNDLDMEKGLNIGQVIRIPVKGDAAPAAADLPKGAPVYYTVGEKEGLYRVSLKNGGVLMADLRKWNNLKTDNLYPGQKLIVGFTTDPKKKQEPVQIIRDEDVVVEKPKEKTEEPKAEPKKIEPVRPVYNPKVATNDGSGGYFRTAFEQQARAMSINKEQTATSGIFKTASGWDDAKYYILIDKVEPGTIVKVSNPANNKVIFAKVLEGMSGIRQNAGLDVRISNAAASVLDISDTNKFIVKVAY